MSQKPIVLETGAPGPRGTVVEKARFLKLSSVCDASLQLLQTRLRPGVEWLNGRHKTVNSRLGFWGRGGPVQGLA